MLTVDHFTRPADCLLASSGGSEAKSEQRTANGSASRRRQQTIFPSATSGLAGWQVTLTAFDNPDMPTNCQSGHQAADGTNARNEDAIPAEIPLVVIDFDSEPWRALLEQMERESCADEPTRLPASCSPPQTASS